MIIKFTWPRLVAMIIKEFIHMKRDRGTFAMIVFLPLLEVILFGYAINSDPHHLHTLLLDQDRSVMTRTLVKGIENTHYLQFTQEAKSEAEAEHELAKGSVQFILNIPAHFTRDLIRNEHPSILLEVDATDPSASGGAIAAVTNLSNTVFNHVFQGNLAYLKGEQPAVNINIQRKYNPVGITQYNIVPGLIGVVLTMTMVMITGIAITRERERGTMENLLATPLLPTEVIIGKIIPYILVGYIQILLIIFVAKMLFQVPLLGSLLLLNIMALPFITANLAVGITISTVAKNQLQAVQMTVFFFLPSILLSGFMFPFAGMPAWAQAIGQALPLTHFLCIIRGILLKGNGFAEIWPNLWPILLFLIIVIFIAVKRYRQTLD